jgi:DNA repair exonuclease SbcCD ATPase subunit
MIQRKIAVISLCLFVFTILTPLSLVYAVEEGGSSTGSSETKPDDSPEVENENEVETEKKNEANKRAKERAEQLKKTAEARREEIKENVEAKKVEIKKDICENRESRLQSLQPRLNNRATEIKTRLDQRYERVVEFYNSKNVTADNYEALIQAIEVAKANTASAISTMEDYKFNVDCSSEIVADQLATYREATSAAKASLKEYRSKIVDLITSIKANTTSSTTEGGSSND